MSTEVAVALIASVTSLIVAFISLVTAILSQRRSRHSQETLENVKFDHSKQLASRSYQDKHLAGPVEFCTPVKATFSPDGNYVLYMYRNPQKGLPLILSPVAGGEEIILIEDANVIQRLFFYNPELTLGLDWAKDGTVYVQTYHGSGVVFNYQP